MFCCMPVHSFEQLCMSALHRHWRDCSRIIGKATANTITEEATGSLQVCAGPLIRICEAAVLAMWRSINSLKRNLSYLSMPQIHLILSIVRLYSVMVFSSPSLSRIIIPRRSLTFPRWKHTLLKRRYYSKESSCNGHVCHCYNPTHSPAWRS